MASDHESFHINPHLKLRQIPWCATIAGGTPEDEMATSDEGSNIMRSELGGNQESAGEEDERGQVHPQVRIKDFESIQRVSE